MPKKTEMGNFFVSPGILCYAEKLEKLFWFSCIGQMAQFDIIKLFRTFRNYFCEFVWTEKKRPVIVAFHFMKHRLKTTEYQF